MKHYKTSTLILILAPFVFSFAFGLDIYVPIVPEMKVLFHTSQANIQLTLSLFLLTAGVGQLFVGPLSDQIGRYRAMLFSCCFFIIGSAACALAPNITVLVIARVVCAFGTCGMLAVAFAIIRDMYSGDEGAQLYSFLNGAIGVSPTFAPIIGGYLAVWLGWSAVFWFLVGLGALALILTKLTITETLPMKKRVPFDFAIFKRYWGIFTNRQFLRYGLFAGFGITVFFCFFSVSPFIIIKLLHVSVEHFGYYFAIFGIVIAMGSVVSGKVVVKIGIEHTIKIGLILIFIGGILMLAWYQLYGLSLTSFMVTTVIACVGAAFFVGPAASGALEPFGHIAGTASATLGCTQFTISAVIGTIMMHWPVTSSMSYAICILIVAVLALINYIFTKVN
tara:strand:+ start:95875 stop:97050 length:1176 start_codon:yes stop_codon:yes gene_type:complete